MSAHILILKISWKRMIIQRFIWQQQKLNMCIQHPHMKKMKMYTSCSEKKSAGIPEEILLDYEETSIRIPMLPHIRSLNLSNSVAIVAYEVLGHQGFEAFQMEGQLHHYHW